MNNSISNFHFSPRHSGYFALLCWAAAVIFVLRQDAYNLDEGAAQSLLLSWSIVDQVASSVVTFGAPDLRFLLYLPIGILWIGNIFAAKVFTTTLLAITVWYLFAWEAEKGNSENALLSSGLLLISPLALDQIDTLSSGIYLLAAFAIGYELDKSYRLTPRIFGGWYFALLFLCALSTSLHPAGLALPIALAWTWHEKPLSIKQQKSFYIGTGITTLVVLIIKSGWGTLTWFSNPVASLSEIAWGASSSGEIAVTRWVTGILFALLLVVAMKFQFKELWSDLLGKCLLLATFLGIVIGDSAWALIALTVILFCGITLLLKIKNMEGGFLHQRGVAFSVILIMSTVFMYSDKMHFTLREKGVLSSTDQLIKILSDEIEKVRKGIKEDDEDKYTPRVASQWPSRTMIACKCDTLHLPPATASAQQQIQMLSGISYVLFDPKSPGNAELASNMSQLGGNIAETIAVQESGVLLRIKDISRPASPNENTSEP